MSYTCTDKVKHENMHLWDFSILWKLGKLLCKMHDYKLDGSHTFKTMIVTEIFDTLLKSASKIGVTIYIKLCSRIKNKRLKWLSSFFCITLYHSFLVINDNYVTFSNLIFSKNFSTKIITFNWLNNALRINLTQKNF